ncbi:C-type lectin domain family 4 member E-like [Megalops cyprinoides]|uniref:C-type lectin domain family 4 member E-like n=1 Tax=Megalops cyprinoides TaxID=118141 RepID=UPI001864E1AC|nr:C-type lectin domain family 4 member E-like [Megalops cyprinoides]
MERNLEHLRANYSKLTETSSQLQRYHNRFLQKVPLLEKYCPLISQKRVCRPCPQGWEQFRSKCYYFSTETKYWLPSRSDCLGQDADLVVIDGEEEQEFISNHTKEGEYWIGLSDSETEGTWLWVDRTPLQKG